MLGSYFGQLHGVLGDVGCEVKPVASGGNETGVVGKVEVLIEVEELAVVGKVEVLIVDAELLVVGKVEVLIVDEAEPAIAVIKAFVVEGKAKLVGFVGTAGSVFVEDESSVGEGEVVSDVLGKSLQKVLAFV